MGWGDDGYKGNFAQGFAMKTVGDRRKLTDHTYAAAAILNGLYYSPKRLHMHAQRRIRELAAEQPHRRG